MTSLNFVRVNDFRLTWEREGPVTSDQNVKWDDSVFHPVEWDKAGDGEYDWVHLYPSEISMKMGLKYCLGSHNKAKTSLLNRVNLTLSLCVWPAICIAWMLAEGSCSGLLQGVLRHVRTLGAHESRRISISVHLSEEDFLPQSIPTLSWPFRCSLPGCKIYLWQKCHEQPRMYGTGHKLEPHWQKGADFPSCFVSRGSLDWTSWTESQISLCYSPLHEAHSSKRLKHKLETFFSKIIIITRTRASWVRTIWSVLSWKWLSSQVNLSYYHSLWMEGALQTEGCLQAFSSGFGAQFCDHDETGLNSHPSAPCRLCVLLPLWSRVAKLQGEVDSLD